MLYGRAVIASEKEKMGEEMEIICLTWLGPNQAYLEDKLISLLTAPGGCAQPNKEKRPPGHTAAHRAPVNKCFTFR